MNKVFIVLTMIQLVVFIVMSNVTFNCSQLLVDFTMWCAFCGMITTIVCYVQTVGDIEE